MKPCLCAAARPILLAGLLLSTQPVAAVGEEGSIRCRGADSAGRRMDGTCTASGPATRSCVTAGGTCTIRVPPGTYTVTLRTDLGRTSPPQTLRVDANSVSTIVLTVDPDPQPSIEARHGTAHLQTMPAGTADAGAGEGRRADAGASYVRTADAQAGHARTRDAGASHARIADADAGTRQHAADPRSAVAPLPIGLAATGGVVHGADAGAVAPAVAPADARAETVVSVRLVADVSLAAASVDPPDRSTGTTLAVQGRVSDPRGRAVDGTVTVFQDGRPIGRAETAGGRFRLYDLPHGILTLTFRSLAGATASTTTRYSGSPVTVHLGVSAP